jgi:hypothetical protein
MLVLGTLVRTGHLQDVHAKRRSGAHEHVPGHVGDQDAPDGRAREAVGDVHLELGLGVVQDVAGLLHGLDVHCVVDPLGDEVEAAIGAGVDHKGGQNVGDAKEPALLIQAVLQRRGAHLPRELVAINVGVVPVDGRRGRWRVVVRAAALFIVGNLGVLRAVLPHRDLVGVALNEVLGSMNMS